MTDDKGMNSQDVVELLRKQLGWGTNQLAMAKKIGISPSYLSEILHCKNPICQEMLDYLGLEVFYKKKRKSNGRNISGSGFKGST